MSEPTRRAAASSPSLPAVVAAGAAVALTIVVLLAVAKLLGIIDPSWVVVTAPLWLPTVGAWSIVVLGGLGAMLLYPTRHGGRR